MKLLCDRETVVPVLRLFANSQRPAMTAHDVARSRMLDSLIERVEYDADVLALALRSIEQLTQLIEANGMGAANELARAKIVLAKR